MLKKLLSLWIAVLCAVSTADVVTKEYSFNSPVARDGGLYLENCQSIESDFEPNVPVKYISLLLPIGQTAESFSVTYGEPVVLQGNFTIKPFIPGGRISVEPPADIHRMLGEAYTKDEFYPPVNTRDNSRYSVQYKNGIPFIIGMIKPLQYNPATGQVRYYPNIRVSVKTIPDKNAPVYKCNNFIRSRLKELVDNPDGIDNLPDSHRGANDYEYLIVTSTTLKDKWSAFIDFNKKRCLRTKVVTVDSIYGISSITGKDNPEKIRKYILQQYTDNNIVFVMLGGDVASVPFRGMHAIFYDYGVTKNEDFGIPADLYYSCLDGTWQVSGSQYYGEYGCEDMTFEVYAARFSVDNETQLNNMINKTIKYSETPVEATIENVLLSGEKAWPKWANGQQLTEYVYGDAEMEELKGTCTNNGYTTTAWPSNIKFSKLYEDPALGGSTWTGQQMISSIKNNSISFIDHVGHSNTNYILKLNTSDVTTNNFINNGTNANFFLVFTKGCYPAAFDNANPPSNSIGSDCIAEQFTSNMATGAVGFIGDTRYGLGADGREGSTGNSPYTDGSNQRFVRYWHDGVSKNMSAEMSNGYAKEQNKSWITNSDLHAKPYHGQMKWVCYELIILGDPALQIWTAKPQKLAPNYPKPLTGTEFTWTSPLPYSWIAITDPSGNILASDMAGSDGKVSVKSDALTAYIAANPSGNAKIRISAHNYYNYGLASGEGDLPINATGILSQEAQKLSIITGVTSTLKSLSVRFKLPVPGNVTLSVCNAKGAVIRSFNRAITSAGEQSVQINTPNLACGIYYCSVQYMNQKASSRFIIAR